MKVFSDNDVFDGKWFSFVFMLTTTAAATAGPRCPSSATENQCQILSEDNGEYFFKIDGIEFNILYSSSDFQLTCSEDVTLENKFLPAFEQEVVVNDVKLSKCHPPPDGYAAVLHTLNITVHRSLTLESVPIQPSLNKQHFDDLNITALEINASNSGTLQPEIDFLESLDRLIDLRLKNVVIVKDAIHHLLLRLKNLKLVKTGIERLEAVTSSLETLVLEETKLTELNVKSASMLRTLQVDAPINGLTLGSSVETLNLRRVRSVELRGNCTALRDVHVKTVTRPLPRGWLAKCPLVENVRLQDLDDGVAGNEEWRGATGLLDLQLRQCSLRALPTDWLEDNIKLRRIDLSFNKIQTLPREVFRSNWELLELDLSDNQLGAEAVAALKSLVSLQTLSLARNPLGDLCQVTGAYDVNAVSSLHPLHDLERLYLRRTGATRICRDWRTEMPKLREIDLSYNNIMRLEFADLQWKGGANLTVALKNQQIRELLYTRDDYIAAVTAAARPALIVTLVANWSLDCDCGEYWAARALKERPAHAPVHLTQAKCADGELLRDRNPERLECTVPSNVCSDGCTCSVNGEYTVLHCERGALRVLPQARPPLPSARLLYAARNNLTRITPLEAIYNLTMLDVSNNNITNIDAATVVVLSAIPERRVLLAGNPLDCGCGALPFLQAVARRAWQIPDLSHTLCKDGRPLAEAASHAVFTCTGGPWWLLGVAALLLLLSIGVAVALYRPVVRHRIKAFLFEHGLCLRWLLRPLSKDDEDDSRRFDAFVSFSHLDAEYADELSAQLEHGSRFWRLCLHERDWIPGEWIPTQIADSVRDSRRTLVLLSEHFLSSDWALEELRAAYVAALREHRPRLMLLLLPSMEPERAAAADLPELRAYLASATYLRWDDPQFWEKLRRALPPPQIRHSVLKPSDVEATTDGTPTAA